MTILVINPGATSTKVSVFEDETEVFKRTIEHDEAALGGFEHVADQKAWRQKEIEECLDSGGWTHARFDAVAGRGGLLRHIPSGTYRINDLAIEDLSAGRFGEHASNLGPLISKSFADRAGIPSFFVDPVSVDELEEVARVSGFKGMERQSFFHALNQKSVARVAAVRLGKPYEALNLVVVHMGGGVSVAAHRKGRVVDVFNVKDEGSFSMDRGGGLPVNALIDFCFSGKSKAEVKRTLGSQAGVLSYLGTRDFREVLRRADSGDAQAKLIYDAMVYQHCKDIGAMAAVLKFQLDAIVLTGGIANSRRLCDDIAGYVGRIAPILELPGEEEMSALAQGALRALRTGEAMEYR
ncbi:MAG: putative butyrate kinase [Spirochaetes bacterium]|nr:MAG: putative butyrate kinase [Spirochaetota bacterium]